MRGREIICSFETSNIADTILGSDIRTDELNYSATQSLQLAFSEKSLCPLWEDRLSPLDGNKWRNPEWRLNGEVWPNAGRRVWD